jgi:DNA polymerase-3 subunit delta'
MTADAVAILLRAIEENRLHHAILLHGPDADSHSTACNRIGARLFNLAVAENVPMHPDFFSARPVGKTRRIKVADLREIVRQISQTSSVGGSKVVVIYDADKMNSESANTFLKTLEEPPGDTHIFLLTSHPSALLDTVRSRCQQFYIPPNAAVADPEWEAWLGELDAWVVSLAEPVKTTKERIAALIFALYGLLSRFEQKLAAAVEARWAVRKAELNNANLEKEDIEAEEAGTAKSIRQSRFAEIAQRLCQIYERAPDLAATRALHASVLDLEQSVRLGNLNLKGASDLEYALLNWLRHWTAVPLRRNEA